MILVPEEVFNKLYKLDIVSTKEQNLEDALFDDHGKIKEVEFPWCRKGNKSHKSWENTVLGYIKIEKDKMTVSVNSNERALKIKGIIDKSLKNKVVYQTTVIEDPTSTSHDHEYFDVDTQVEDDLNNDPEVLEMVSQMMKKHWENWVNEKVPALGNKTPKQAAKTKDGRELLNALLIDFERSVNERPLPGVDHETFLNIRRQLGVSRDE